jgi:hypothetical protein
LVVDWCTSWWRWEYGAGGNDRQFPGSFCPLSESNTYAPKRCASAPLFDDCDPSFGPERLREAIGRLYLLVTNGDDGVMEDEELTGS